MVLRGRSLETYALSLRARRRTRASTSQASPFSLPDLRSTRRADASRLVGVVVYQGVTTAEIDEPVRRLATRLEADVVHIAALPAEHGVVGVEPVRTVHIDATIDEPIALEADVLVLPGGLGWERLVDDLGFMAWLAHASKAAAGVLAMSTGSLLLAAAGRLDGEAATGHWLARDALSALGVDVRTSRTMHCADDRIVTASGATAASEIAADLADRVRWGPA